LSSARTPIAVLADRAVGLELLSWLIERHEDIRLCAFDPGTDEPTHSELVALADRAGLTWVDYCPDDLDRFVDTINSVGPIDLLLCLWFGRILPEPVLRLPGLGAINIHPALLPLNRGKHPNIWSIVDRTPAGVTIHFLDQGIDTGPIILQRPVPVLPSDTGQTLYERLLEASVETFKEAWLRVLRGEYSSIPQSGPATLHRARDLERISEIDLNRTYLARELIDLLRARTFPPYDGCYFVVDGQRYYLRLELYTRPDEEAGQDV